MRRLIGFFTASVPFGSGRGLVGFLLNVCVRVSETKRQQSSSLTFGLANPDQLKAADRPFVGARVCGFEGDTWILLQR